MNNESKKQTQGIQNIESYFHNNIVLGRGIVSPCQKNPFSVYNETFAETEIRKLGRRNLGVTKTKESGTKRGNPNRACCILGEGALLFEYVGYTVENPSIEDVRSVDFCKYGTGEGKRSVVHEDTNNLGKKFNVSLEERGKVLHEVTMLRNEIRQYLRNKGINVEDERNEFFRIKKEIKRLPRDIKKRGIKCLNKLGYGKGELEYLYLSPIEFAANLHNDNKIKYIYINKSNDVMSTTKKYSDEVKLLMAVYLRDKFKEKLNRNLEIISCGNGEKTKMECIDNNRIAFCLSKSLDSSMVSKEKIDLLNHFSKVIKNDKNYSLNEKVVDILKNSYEKLPQKVFREKLDDYYYSINLTKALKKFGLNGEGDNLLLRYLNRLPENFKALNSDFIISVKNVAITRNADLRFANGLHKMSLRGDYDILKIRSYLDRIKNEIKSESYKLISSEKKPQVDKCFQEIDNNLKQLYPLIDKIAGNRVTKKI